MSKEEEKAKTSSTALGEALKEVILALAVNADDTDAKNHLTMELSFDGGVAPELPFNRVSLSFIRHGALSPIQQKNMADERRKYLERALKIEREKHARTQKHLDEFMGAVATETVHVMERGQTIRDLLRMIDTFPVAMGVEQFEYLKRLRSEFDPPTPPVEAVPEVIP